MDDAAPCPGSERQRGSCKAELKESGLNITMLFKRVGVLEKRLAALEDTYANRKKPGPKPKSKPDANAADIHDAPEVAQ